MANNGLIVTAFAPMVRIGTLPMRLLAAKEGADFVYCEEIIDLKMLSCQRVVNKLLGTIDYVWTDGTIVFRTTAAERSRLIFQIGTCDGQRALKVAKMVEQDVSEINVNMGCPKAFSIQGGMGAALLSQPEKVELILKTLVGGLSIRVSCKIRLLKTEAETIKLVKLIESTGVSSIIVHGRRVEERPRHDNNVEMIRRVAECVKIPVFANGNSNKIKCYEDIVKFQQETKTAGACVARAAMWNPSIFNKNGLRSIDEMIHEYLKYAILYSHTDINPKFCIQQMMHKQLSTPLGQSLLAASTLNEICSLFNMTETYQHLAWSRCDENKIVEGVSSDGCPTVSMNFKFLRKEYAEHKVPKQILYNWTQLQQKAMNYVTIYNEIDRRYHSKVKIDDVWYMSSLWDKSKKYAEQAAAAVFLRAHNMDDGMKEEIKCLYKRKMADGMDGDAEVFHSPKVAKEN